MSSRAGWAIAVALAAATSGAGAPQRPYFAPVQIVSEALPDEVAGRPYQARIEARGGRPPLRWSTGTAPLPSGLNLNPATGEITGTPRVAETRSFAVRVTDAASRWAQREFTLRVAEPLAIVTETLPSPMRAESYRASLRARGGIPPLRWAVVEGSLPGGLILTPNGELEGTPAAAGRAGFTVEVADSARPAQSARRPFSLGIQAFLVEWVRAPRVDGGGIHGSVRVTNATQKDLEVTLIIEAINGIGKAFVLGYHRMLLPAGVTSPEVPFGSALPRGSYAVRSDAVGESAATLMIWRTHLELPQRMAVQ